MGLNISKSMTHTYYEVNISQNDVLNYFYVLFACDFLKFIGSNIFYYTLRTLHKINIKYAYFDYIAIFCAFICDLFGQKLLDNSTIDINDFSLEKMRNFVKTVAFL